MRTWLPAWLLTGWVVACGASARSVLIGAAGAAVPPPPLLDPLPGDPAAFGATYLAQVADQLRDPWRTYVESSRVHLSPTHPLNDPTLVATVELVRGSDGDAQPTFVARSAVPDFDLAVDNVLDDLRLPPPPPELLGDDGVLRLRWQFARDRRGAGWATAAVTPTVWPATQAVPALLARGDLARAAARATAGTTEPELVALANLVLRQILRDELLAMSEALRDERAALVARETPAVAFADRLRAARSNLREFQALSRFLELPAPRRATERWLEDLDANVDAARVLRWLAAVPVGVDALRDKAAAWLSRAGQAPRALEVFRVIGAGAQAGAIARWGGDRDPQVVVAACAALATELARSAVARRAVVRALGHASAIARSGCARALGAAPAVPDAIVARLVRLLRDADAEVQASAAAALATTPMTGEVARQLEAQFVQAPVLAAAIAAPPARSRWPARVQAAVTHDDPAVRAAAVRHFAGEDLILAAARRDPDPAVRLAAVETGPWSRDLTLLDDPSVAVQHAAWRQWVQVDELGALAEGMRRVAAQQLTFPDGLVALAVGLVDPLGEHAQALLAASR